MPAKPPARLHCSGDLPLFKGRTLRLTISAFSFAIQGTYRGHNRTNGGTTVMLDCNVSITGISPPIVVEFQERKRLAVDVNLNSGDGEFGISGPGCSWPGDFSVRAIKRISLGTLTGSAQKQQGQIGNWGGATTEQVARPVTATVVVAGKTSGTRLRRGDQTRGIRLTLNLDFGTLKPEWNIPFAVGGYSIEPDVSMSLLAMASPGGLQLAGPMTVIGFPFPGGPSYSHGNQGPNLPQTGSLTAAITANLRAV